MDDWPAWVISAIAVGVSIWGLTHSRSAAKSSERSAKASEDSAREAKRAADAAEREIALLETEAARYDVSWEVTHDQRGTYQVTNSSRESRYRVDVSGPVLVISDLGTIQPGEAFTFADTRSFG